MKSGENLTASVKLKNTGARAGTAVAQLYIRAPGASAGPRPVRELKGFQKILSATRRIARRGIHIPATILAITTQRPLAGRAGEIPAMDFQTFRVRRAGGFELVK